MKGPTQEKLGQHKLLREKVCETGVGGISEGPPDSRVGAGIRMGQNGEKKESMYVCFITSYLFHFFLHVYRVEL